MPNRNLTECELVQARELLKKIRDELAVLSGGDQERLFAFRRKIFKELGYDERNTPAHRNKVKKLKLVSQDGQCVGGCQQPLPKTYAILDRFEAYKGYTVENTRLICRSCDERIQAERRYS